MILDTPDATLWLDDASAQESALANWAKLIAILQHKHGLGPKPSLLLTVKSQPEDLGGLIIASVKRQNGRREPFRYEAQFVPAAAPHRAIIQGYQRWSKQLLALANEHRLELAAKDERELAGRLIVREMVAAVASSSRSPWAVAP